MVTRALRRVVLAAVEPWLWLVFGGMHHPAVDELGVVLLPGAINERVCDCPSEVGSESPAPAPLEVVLQDGTDHALCILASTSEGDGLQLFPIFVMAGPGMVMFQDRGKPWFIDD